VPSPWCPTFAAALLGVMLKNRTSEVLFRRALLFIIVIVSLLGFLPHREPLAKSAPLRAQTAPARDMEGLK